MRYAHEGRQAAAALRRGEAGFTLVEILVVITIIGLIMAIVGPRVLNYLGESKVKAAKIQIESFSSALDLYYLDIGRYPAIQRRPGRAGAAAGQCARVERPVSEGRRRSRTIHGDTLMSIDPRSSERPTRSSRLVRMVRRAALEPLPTFRAIRRVRKPTRALT